MYSENGEKRRQVAEEDASNKRQKEETLEGLKAQLIGLNRDFASWVAGNLQNNPAEIWRDGALNYVAHTDKLLKTFQQLLQQPSSTRNSTSGSNNSGAPFGSPSPPLQQPQPAASHAVAAAAPTNVLGALSPRPNAPAFAFALDPHSHNNNPSGPPTPSLMPASEGGPGSGPASPFGFGAAATPPPASRTPGGTNSSLAPLAFTLSSGTGSMTGDHQAQAYDVATRNPYEKKATALAASAYVSPMFGGAASAVLDSGRPTPASAVTGSAVSWGSAPASGKGFSFTAQTASATAEAAAATTPNLGWGNATAAPQLAASRPVLVESAHSPSNGDSPDAAHRNNTSVPPSAFNFGAAAQSANATAAPNLPPLSGWTASRLTTVPEASQPPSIFAAPTATVGVAFGSAAVPAPAAATSAFGFFGAAPAAAAPPTTATTGFGFGGASATAGFGFGSAAPAAVTSSVPIAAPAAGLFSFGGSNTSAPAASNPFAQPAATGFSFGGASATNATTTAPFGASMFSLPTASFAPAPSSGAGPSASNGEDETEPAPQDEYNKEPMKLKASSDHLFREKSKCFVMDKVTKGWMDKGVGYFTLLPGQSAGKPYLTFTTDSGKVLLCVGVYKTMKIIVDEKASAVRFTAMWAPDPKVPTEPKEAPSGHSFMLRLPKGKPVILQQAIEALQPSMAS